MTQNTPDPKTFDIADWLTGGTEHRPTREVTVYRDLSLAAEVERIRGKLDALDAAPVTDSEGNPEESIGDAAPSTERTNLEAQAEELLERMRAAKVTLRITGLIRPEEMAIRKALEAAGKTTNDPDYDYAVLARAAEFPGGARITAEQWEKFHATIGQGQFIRIVQEYQAAMMQVPDVSAPFSRSSSRKVTGR